MSLSRLALRLATIEALRPTASLAADGPWPTLAGKHVFDSRLDPVNDLREEEARPLVCIYTDDDDWRSGQARGGPPFLVIADLCFECSVVVKVRAEGEPQRFIIGEPETDAELEASLDLLGAQIAFTLLYAPCGQIFRNVCGSRVIAPKSAVHRTSEEGARLARRAITWKVEINSERFDPAPVKHATGIEALPEPLRALARALPDGSYGRQIIAGLIDAPSLPRMPRRVPLSTVGLNAQVEPPGQKPAAPITPNIAGVVTNLATQEDR